jgi:D-threo-aldose 1-dehydrogenase
MAGRYTLLDRSAVAELLPFCRQKGTSLVVGGVFNSGILATGPVPGSHFDYMPANDDVLAKVGAMEAIAKKHGVPLAAPALQFPLRNPLVSSVLIGTAKASSLERNMQLFEPALPDTIFPEFDNLTLVAPPLGDEAIRV